MTRFHRPLNLPANREALIERAAAEGDGITSVGGFAAPRKEGGGTIGANRAAGTRLSRPGLIAIARLLQLARRQAGQTRER